MKTRTKEENAAYARAQRAKKKAGSVSPVSPCILPGVSPVSPGRVSPIKSVSPNVSPDSLSRLIEEQLEIKLMVKALSARVRDLELILSGDGVSRRIALKPGAHPTELYGA